MGSKATSAPMCKLCGTAHWSQQPHDRAGIARTHKPTKGGATAPTKNQHRQGHGSR